MGGFRIYSSKMQNGITHPLFGPLGATMGKTMPTTPQSTVKMRNGTNEAPIVRNYGREEHFDNFSEKMATVT